MTAFTTLAMITVGVVLLFVLLMFAAVVLLTVASIKLDDFNRERKHLQRR